MQGVEQEIEEELHMMFVMRWDKKRDPWIDVVLPKTRDVEWLWKTGNDRRKHKHSTLIVSSEVLILLMIIRQHIDPQLVAVYTIGDYELWLRWRRDSKGRVGGEFLKCDCQLDAVGEEIWIILQNFLVDGDSVDSEEYSRGSSMRHAYVSNWVVEVLTFPEERLSFLRLFVKDRH